MAYDLSTPDGREAANAARRKHYRLKCAPDPVWVEAHRKRCREAMRARRQAARQQRAAQLPG